MEDYEMTTFTEMKNIVINPDTTIKRIGFKTLRGYIQILKRQNKQLKKFGLKAKFEIELPIPN